MRYNLFGSTGLVVSELCLGTMTFGSMPGQYATVAGLDQSQADKLVRISLDAGINFIDTANLYSAGQSEEIVGQALKNLGIQRDQVVIATKAMTRVGPGPNQRGTSRYHLFHAIDDSLKRLQLDHVDLYQMHGWDTLTPVEETVSALDDLVRSGKVRYVGVSNWAAWQVEKALGVAAREHLVRFQSVQAYYSLAGRELERELVPMIQAENLALTIWGPLASGALSGKYTREGGDGRRNVMDVPPIDHERTFTIVDRLREIATKRGATVAQVALSWLLHKRAVTSVIIGVKTEKQLRDNLGSCDVMLDDEDLRALDEVSAPASEYPQWMFDMQRNYFSEGLPSPRRR